MDDPDRGDVESFASPAQIRVAQAAAAAAPHAAALMTEHLSDHGELLPIMYFDTLGVWYLAAWRRRDADPDQFAQAGAVAAVLDAQLKSDPGLENAIAVGFVEMFTFLPASEQAAAAATLPPVLRAEYTAMAAWRPS
ncbi:hypothetical protein QRX50_08415 [Amycolatopsis carbonis]|uniref:Uncharacterized protein n=1 Tax=Amycolatopsis carbonis TaxID=715471 RepID=A0A9Y2ILZ4_9PSEU|nr:hypothetical protein [Amycolatopsis sp. 2-15]WIX80773.1 hypothetical protein QRX50_08415 [Amycolatopsis sp. 2-15]